MPIKKMINNEPEWDIMPTKSRSLEPPTWGATITLNAPNDKGTIYANINFGERAAMRFRGKVLKFSSKALPDRLYFKEAEQGYKATSTKAVTVRIPLPKSIEHDFTQQWAYRSYQIKEEGTYYYFEQSNELQALFDDDPKPATKKPSSYPALITSAPSGGAYMQKDIKALFDEMALSYVQTVGGSGENGIWNKKHCGKLMKLTLDYGYATVNVPIITEDGTRAIATMLWDGTGRWE